MGKMIAILGGLIAMVGSVVLLVTSTSWWWAFKSLVKGFIPPILFFGGLIGLLLGGLLTARPDHVRVITTVRRAIRRGRWAVVIHPVTQRQLDVAMRELRTHSTRVVRSL